MKNLFIALFVFIGFGINAQISDGKFLVSGSIGINSSGGSTATVTGGTTVTEEGVSVTGFNIMPKVGTMLTQNIAAGLGLGYGTIKTKTPDFFDNDPYIFEQVEKDIIYTVSPFARYYEGIADNFYLFAELNLPISFGNHKELMWNDDMNDVINSDTQVNFTTWGIQMGLGLNYFLSDILALEAGFNLFDINYNNVTASVEYENGDKETVKSSGFNFNFDMENLIDLSSFTIGIVIFI